MLKSEYVVFQRKDGDWYYTGLSGMVYRIVKMTWPAPLIRSAYRMIGFDGLTVLTAATLREIRKAIADDLENF